MLTCTPRGLFIVLPPTLQFCHVFHICASFMSLQSPCRVARHARHDNKSLTFLMVPPSPSDCLWCPVAQRVSSSLPIKAALPLLFWDLKFVDAVRSTHQCLSGRAWGGILQPADKIHIRFWAQQERLTYQHSVASLHYWILLGDAGSSLTDWQAVCVVLCYSFLWISYIAL